MEEIWKPIKNYEGYYAVSNLGRIKSLKRIIQPISKLGKVHKPYAIKEKILKPGKNSEGYLTVALCKNGSQKTVKVHVAVALAFLGEKPESCVICHGKEGKLNNSVFNLRYDTLEANEKDKIRDKTSQHIFSPEKILEIRELHAQSKLPYARIASMYNVDSNCIRKIILRISYKHVV
jgi:hypothetical protein